MHKFFLQKIILKESVFRGFHYLIGLFFRFDYVIPPVVDYTHPLLKVPSVLKLSEKKLGLLMNFNVASMKN